VADDARDQVFIMSFPIPCHGNPMLCTDSYKVVPTPPTLIYPSCPPHPHPFTRAALPILSSSMIHPRTPSSIEGQKRTPPFLVHGAEEGEEEHGC
jgi:hypothetical protein